MPINYGPLTLPADGDPADAESVNVAFRELLAQMFDESSLRNPRIARLTGTLNGARCAIGINVPGEELFGPTLWVVGGDSGDAALSVNGQEWTEVEDCATQHINGLAFRYATGAETLFAVGAAGMFGRCSIAELKQLAPVWSYSTPGASYAQQFRAVAIGTTHIVVVGDAGEIQRVAVGGPYTTLTHIASGASYAGDFREVIYDESYSRFIAFGDDGEVQYSDDEGATWTSIGLVGTDWNGAATNGDGTIIAAGNDVARISHDGGETWASLGADTASGTSLDVVWTGLHFAVLTYDTAECSLWWVPPSATAYNPDKHVTVSAAMVPAGFGAMPSSDGTGVLGIIAVGDPTGFTIATFPQHGIT